MDPYGPPRKRPRPEMAVSMNGTNGSNGGLDWSGKCSGPVLSKLVFLQVFKKEWYLERGRSFRGKFWSRVVVGFFFFYVWWKEVRFFIFYFSPVCRKKATKCISPGGCLVRRLTTKLFHASVEILITAADWIM